MDPNCVKFVLITIALITIRSHVNGVDERFFQIQIEKIDYETLKYGTYAMDTGSQLTIGSNYQKICLMKIDRRQHCYENGVCPEIKIFWNFPVWLKEAQIKNYDIRTIIRERPVKRFPATPDDEVHSSTLFIRDAGLLHFGQFACVFKFINKETGKINSEISHTFTLTVEGGNQHDKCRFDDQCQSDSCIDSQCKCDDKNRIYNAQDGQCYPDTKLGEKCSFKRQCKLAVGNNAVCLCPNQTRDCEEKVCGCIDGFTKSLGAFGKEECLPLVTLGGKCKHTDQCSAADPKTFCSFGKTCKCRSDQSCREPSLNRVCISHLDCFPGEFCLKGTCSDKKDIGEACQENEQCLAINDETWCNTTTKTCTCKLGYKYSSEEICIPQSQCHSDADCADQEGYCYLGYCKAGKNLLEPCSTLNQCVAKDNRSYCSTEDGICKCLYGYYPRILNGKDICTVKNGCFLDEDCKERSYGFCTENLCSYRAYLSETCETTEECINASNFTICNRKTRKCECLKGFDQHDKQCLPSSCKTDSECSLKNQEYVCNQGKCGCKRGYYLSSFSKCIEDPRQKPKPAFIDNFQLYIIIGAIIVAVLLLLAIISMLVASRMMRRESSQPNATQQQRGNRQRY